METVMKDLLEIHEIFKHYKNIHDDIFKTSIRRIIPIPGIFKPINFGPHRETLSNLSKGLQIILLKINNNTEIAIILKEFGDSLLNTILMLHNISENLYNKSQGYLSSYSDIQYEADINKYKSVKEKCQSNGILLNKAIANFKESETVKAHILDPMKGCYIDDWVLDRDISKEDVKGFVTTNGDLYVLICYKEGQQELMITKKEVWERQRNIFNLIESGQDHQSELDSAMNDLKDKINNDVKK